MGNTKYPHDISTCRSTCSSINSKSSFPVCLKSVSWLWKNIDPCFFFRRYFSSSKLLDICMYVALLWTLILLFLFYLTFFSYSDVDLPACFRSLSHGVRRGFGQALAVRQMAAHSSPVHDGLSFCELQTAWISYR